MDVGLSPGVASTLPPGQNAGATTTGGERLTKDSEVRELLYELLVELRRTREIIELATGIERDEE